jgi:hypothetical protein
VKIFGDKCVLSSIFIYVAVCMFCAVACFITICYCLLFSNYSTLAFSFFVLCLFSFYVFLYFVYSVFLSFLCIVNFFVFNCLVPSFVPVYRLPPQVGNPIAQNKYRITYFSSTKE